MSRKTKKETTSPSGFRSTILFDAQGGEERFFEVNGYHSSAARSRVGNPDQRTLRLKEICATCLFSYGPLSISSTLFLPARFPRWKGGLHFSTSCMPSGRLLVDIKWSENAGRGSRSGTTADILKQHIERNQPNA